MNIRVYEGKSEEELLERVISELNISEDQLIYSFTHEKVGLLKKEVVKIHFLIQDDILDYSKEFLTNVLSNMKIEASFESKKRDNQIYINIVTNKNSILIGKNGQTLSALNNILKQSIYNKIKVMPHITLDVGNYKDSKDHRLEKMAMRLAKEVAKTKVEVELENMNSYDRRIIHNVLSDNKNVYTISEGIEPNRHIIIKPKEE